MKPYKQCFCRDRDTGKRLRKGCPQLENRGHGKWYVKYEAPADPATGRRRQPELGPFDTAKAAKEAAVAAVGQVAKTGHDVDRAVKVGDYLDKRLAWRVSESEAGGGLARSTLQTEREAIELYFKPGLGHLKLHQLRDHHIRELYAAMRLINREAGGGEGDEQQAELLRRLLEARASRDGQRISNRPISEARIRRMHAVLVGALNDAVRVSRLIDSNPAAFVFATAKGGGRKGRVKPLAWTAARTAHWEQTGRVPAKVMVWGTVQCGAFLDFAEFDRLYALWHLAAFWGLRRGELLGLEWPDVDLETRKLHVRQAQPDDELDDVKSETSDRVITIDEATAAVLRSWRKTQLEERLAWGEAWAGSGRVFTYENGAALKPDYVSVRFGLLVERYQALRRRAAEGWDVERIARKHRTDVGAVRVALAGPALPPVRFHDLRHGAATMLHAAGVSMKAVSEIMGHASESFTSDVYAVVADELAEDAAAKIAAFVPRRHRG